MKYKYVGLDLLIVFAFLGSLCGQMPGNCRITSDPAPPPVSAGATHTFIASCKNPTWSVTGPGSINPTTGVYTAPATVWAQDVSRGIQLLPNDNVYKLPINNLPVDPRSAYWMQRVKDDSPGVPNDHSLKLGTPGLLNFYDNVVTNATPTQLMHFYYLASRLISLAGHSVSSSLATQR